MVDRLADYHAFNLPSAARRPAGAPGDDQWRTRLSTLADHVTAWVVEHPEVALTAAVATGAVLRWLIKRR